MHPTFGNGKICYVEIPSNDIPQSAKFYNEVFGWVIRQRENGQLVFDDAVKEVSGTWVTGRKPMTEVSLLIYIMVDSIADTITAVLDHGGKLIHPIAEVHLAISAIFSDPDGNIFGLYQQPSKKYDPETEHKE